MKYLLVKELVRKRCIGCCVRESFSKSDMSATDMDNACLSTRARYKAETGLDAEWCNGAIFIEDTDEAKAAYVAARMEGASP